MCKIKREVKDKKKKKKMAVVKERILEKLQNKVVRDLAGRVFKSAINRETSNCLANRFAPAGKVYFIKSHLSSGQKSYR